MKAVHQEECQPREVTRTLIGQSESRDHFPSGVSTTAGSRAAQAHRFFSSNNRNNTYCSRHSASRLSRVWHGRQEESYKVNTEILCPRYSWRGSGHRRKNGVSPRSLSPRSLSECVCVLKPHRQLQCRICARLQMIS